MKHWHATAAALIASITCSVGLASADIMPGILSNFESGTTDGWGGGARPTIIPTGGPAGVGDSYLQIGGGFSNLGANNTQLSGILDPRITEIQVDMFRDSGQSDLEMRLVFRGVDSGVRWTSSDAVLVEGDGQWRTYSFSVLEADLTDVGFVPTPFPELAGDVGRILLRHDEGAPSTGGDPAPGFLGIDNIIAIVPEPSAIVLLGFAAAAIGPTRPSRVAS